jgi:hypothetical protein
MEKRNSSGRANIIKHQEKKPCVREGQEVESRSLLSAAACWLYPLSLISACAQCVIFDEMFYVGPPALFAKRDALMLLELHSLCETTNWNTNNYYWHYGHWHRWLNN